MENILFEHNQKAYEAAASMLAQTGRAAIIHPTGTGKSFIAFQLCAEHPESKVCFLSPSEYIFRTQLEKWHAAGGMELRNVEFITYARLMRMGEDELARLTPDYIVLDEFHRCGAAQWGSGVERLREMYPGAKVLGLSATNIRYLDNQRDMAWELFGGNVASELTLGAAVATGILPAPKYVLSVYSYQKELKRYEIRVRQARNKAVRDQAEKELEALRRALEKADGLADVFARHMLPEAGKVSPGAETAGYRGNADGTIHSVSGEKLDALMHENPEHSWERETSGFRETAGQTANSSKYIVFCASYEHLLEMRELAPEWFAKVDAEPHIYTAYSDDPATSAEFGAFKADTSGHLKLLYCIDMLNEGIHVDGVDGVILLRPTVSPTIYKQQIGRALASGGKKAPVIFDIVMNIENLYSIGAVEEELRGAVFAYRAGGRGGEIVNEHFRVIDELGDCRRLFAQLNETLGASWDAMYAMAEEYYRGHGNLEIPAKYATADGYSLGAWVLTQRKVYAGKTAGCLSEAQVERLSAIGMRWQGTQEVAWERNFAEAESYFKAHGDLDVPADYVTEGGCRLGRWLRRQREVYRKLVGAGKPGEGVSVPDMAVGSAEGHPGAEYMEKDGAALPENTAETASINALFSGRERQGNQSVHWKRVQRLTQIGMVWEISGPWERKFELARQYYEEHGNLHMAADYVVEGVWLDRWLREQKARLEEESENALQTQENLQNPSAFLDGNIEHGNIPEGKRTRKAHIPLTEGQKQKLLSIGLKPGVSQAEISWREQYGEAEEFYRTHGNLSIPKRYTAANGKNLGVWLQHQRANRRNGRLAGWQVHLLDGIGMVWESANAWETGFAHAQEYAQQTGDLEVPNAYVCADGYRLGKWISNQRCAYSGIMKKGLREEQVRRLEKIGMVWSVGQGRRVRNLQGREAEIKQV